MPDISPEFELKNAKGTTSVFTGNTSATPGTTTSVPGAAGNFVEKFEILNLSETDVLDVSMDGGSTFYPIDVTTAFEWDPRGMKQLVIKSTGASQAYQATINFEDFD